jgi:hypothetical protein
VERPRIVSRTARRISFSVVRVGFHGSLGIGIALLRVMAFEPLAPLGARPAWYAGDDLVVCRMW